MLHSAFFHEQLVRQGIRFFTGVPDSLLADYCAFLTDHVPQPGHIIAANEGGAVGLAIGHYLATGSPGLVYMQNSGQGNAVNPLMSLADAEVYGVPMVLLVGWRGEPGHKDEPQHVKQGKITLDLFAAMGIPYALLPEEETAAAKVVEAQVRRTIRKGQPVALVVRKGTFSPCPLKYAPSMEYALSREEAIGCVMDAAPRNTVVVSTTGKASRELYEARERLGAGHESDFLTVGGMGHASQIALGIALARNSCPVYCLDGDGAALMHLGGMGVIASCEPPNLKHILLNNGVHDSVGGQPTLGLRIDFCRVAQALGYRETFLATNRAELVALLPRIARERGPLFVEVRVAPGARHDLGRPGSSPAQNKAAFMEYVRAQDI